MITLQGRARFYATIINLLYTREEMTGGQLRCASRGARHLSFGIRLRDPVELDKALRLSENIALSANVENVLAQRQAGLVVYQFQLAQGLWQHYTRADLEKPTAVGLAERRQPVDFVLDPPHALIAGTTGSGKSEAIKSILISLITTMTPDKLGIVICDQHGDYYDFDNEVHLEMPIARTPEEIENALLYCQEVLRYRKAEDIKDGKILLFILDEGEETLNESRCAILKILTQGGRKYRVHCIIGTQKPSHKELPGILDNLLNRFVGLVADGKVSANLTGHAGLQAHKLTGAGDFIHVVGQDSLRFQVAMATQPDFDALERGEVKPVEAMEQTDIVDLPPELPERKPGRPKLQLNPEYVAWYLYHYPEKISRAVAKELMDISRDSHDLHNKFSQQVIEAYLKLQSQRLQLGGGN
jgi:hypothetical protein